VVDFEQELIQQIPVAANISLYHLILEQAAFHHGCFFGMCLSFLDEMDKNGLRIFNGALQLG
jgi:hypothetical protein